MATDAHVLLRAYCGLVLMELALKDHLALTGLKHDVPAMLHRLANNATQHRPTLNQFRAELAVNLAKLHTQNNNGTNGRVNAQVFPGIRYLRHSDDWNNNCSTEQDLSNLRGCVTKILYYLRDRAHVQL